MDRNVLIGIQARSTSTRFPGKCYELIGDKPLLTHVIKACDRAVWYVNKNSHGLNVSFALLIPEGDGILKRFHKEATVLEGPEHDVLARYAKAARTMDADFVCRVTGDCPLIPPFLISKLIKIATHVGYDYLSNVDPRLRMSPDGHDCEVVSLRLLKYMDERAQRPDYREHVTMMAREEPPSWAKIGHVEGHLDLSSLKLSVDTPEDLERVREEYRKKQEKVDNARDRFGHESVHII